MKTNNSKEKPKETNEKSKKTNENTYVFFKNQAKAMAKPIKNNNKKLEHNPKNAWAH